MLGGGCRLLGGVLIGGPEAENVEEFVEAGEAVEVGEPLEDELSVVVCVVPTAEAHGVFESATFVVNAR